MKKIIISKTVSFNAAHRLHAPSLSDEENKTIFGKFNNPRGHGHNYTLELQLYGGIDPINGMVVNLTEDCPEFQNLVPTAENIAVVIWEKLAKTSLKAQLYAVILYETERNKVIYHGPQ